MNREVERIISTASRSAEHPLLIVLNKIDLVKKEDLLDAGRRAHGDG